MKIVISVYLFPPNWVGGTELASFNIAKCLASKGHEVHVITKKDDIATIDDTLYNFHLHRIKYSNIRILRPIFILINTSRIIININPDIIQAQNLYMGMYTILSKFILKKPLVLYARGSDVYFNLKNPLIKYILNNADCTIALTREMGDKLQGLTKQIIIIPNGIDVSKYNKIPRNKAKQQLKIYDDKILIYVGSLRPVKGIEYLIMSINELKVKYPKIKLLIIGDGNEKIILENMVKDYKLENNILFIGQIKNNDVPDYLSAADIFILPSLSEGFPNVLLEAMASGLPIIATKISGIDDIISNYENGLLIELKNSKQITEKVDILLTNEVLYNKISKNNLEKANKYSWNNVIKCLEEIYEKV